MNPMIEVCDKITIILYTCIQQCVIVEQKKTAIVDRGCNPLSMNFLCLPEIYSEIIITNKERNIPSAINIQFGH